MFTPSLPLVIASLQFFAGRGNPLESFVLLFQKILSNIFGGLPTPCKNAGLAMTAIKSREHLQILQPELELDDLRLP